jgi:Fe2+ or Zn2+ uptake regulation protein
MKKTYTQVILSEKFQQSMKHMNMYEHLSKTDQSCFKGGIKTMYPELYVLQDENGCDVCGLLDQKSFMEALLETNVAHLWTVSKN